MNVLTLYTERFKVYIGIHSIIVVKLEIGLSQKNQILLSNEILTSICYVQPSCSTILFMFVYSTSVVLMLLHDLTTTPSLLISQTKVDFIRFIFHSLSHSFHLS